MAAKGIHHVALTVNDWDRCRAFYTRLAAALGTRPIIEARGPPHQDPDGRVLVFAGEGFMYSIWESKKEFRGNKFQFYNVGLHHYAFAAGSRADVDALHEVLVQMSAEIIDPPKEYSYAPGYYAVFFRDPEGIKLEYAHVPG